LTNQWTAPKIDRSTTGEIVMAAAAKKMIDTMDEAQKARADAIMKGWFAFNEKALELETACNAKVEEIGRAASDMIAEKIGISEDLIQGRNAEFGRILANAVRTFNMQLPYKHQANDALIKEQLKCLDYAQTRCCEAEMISHDVASMKEIFEERRYWIEETGDITLALDAITTPTCFRDLTVAEGMQFNADRSSITYVSPYKRILEKGWLRGIWTGLTEQYIHDVWTIPRFKGYQNHFGVEFRVSEWNEDDRIVTISVHPGAS
jgi:hypothetical protein